MQKAYAGLAKEDIRLGKGQMQIVASPISMLPFEIHFGAFTRLSMRQAKKGVPDYS